MWVLTNFFRVLGWSSLAGVVVVLVVYTLNYPLAKYNVYVRIQDNTREISIDLEGSLPVLDYSPIVEGEGQEDEFGQWTFSKYPIPQVLWMGWGSCFRAIYFDIVIDEHCSETRWSERVRESRETELTWRVKANIVDIVMSFIWQVQTIPFRCS